MMNQTSGDASKDLLDPDFPAAPVDAGEGGPEEDFRLVALAQQGDSRAYDALVTRHRGRVYAMIRNMIHHETDAWDLSQEVFIKAWHALPRFEAKARFTTWLYRITHNVVYDFTRRRKIQADAEWDEEWFERQKIDPAAQTAPAGGEAPDTLLGHGELRAAIEAALARLSPEHREVVLLKDAQGLAYKEIAEVMGCTLGTVMSRLFYARQKLQTLLKHEYESR